MKSDHMLRYLWLLLAVIRASYGEQFTSDVDDLVWAEIDSQFQQPGETADLINSLRDCLSISNKTSNNILKLSYRCEGAALILESRHVNQLKHSQRDRPLKIDTIPTGTTYFSMFEDYIINNRIFQTDFKEAALALSIDKVNKTAVPYVPWLSKLSLTTEVAQQMTLPAIAANSYIRRLNETVVSSLEIAFDGFPCYGHVCLVHGSDDSESSPYFQCPAGGSILLWSLDEKTENVKITVVEAKKMHEEVIFTPDQASHSLQMRRVFRNEQSQEMPTTTASLSSQQLLFIPRPFAISVQNPSQANIAMLCVVDASNLNIMRIEARNAALAGSSVHRQIYHYLTHPSLLSTQSLVRRPVALSLQSFYDKSSAVATAEAATESTPDTAATTNKNDRRNRRQKGDFKAWQETAAWRSFLGGLTLPPPPRPFFSSVQREDVSLTFSLPLATLPPEADRTAFGFELTICKTSTSLLAGTSLAVSLLPPADDSEDEPKIASCEVEETRVYLLGNTSLHLSVATVVRGGGDEEVANFMLHISSLSAATRYQFSLRLRYGTAMQGVQRGPSSPYTPMIMTYPLIVSTTPRPVMAHLLEVDIIRPSSAAPTKVEGGVEKEWWRDEDEGSIVIRFRAPEDDGGRPILGYWVFMRVAANNFPTSYHSLGAFAARLSSTHHIIAAKDVYEILISKRILPLTLPLEFRIAAVSEVGVSRWSSPTLPIIVSAIPLTSMEAIEGEDSSISGSREKKARLLSLLWGSNYKASSNALSKTFHPLPSTYLSNKNLEVFYASSQEDQAAFLLLSLPHQQISVIQSNPLPFRPPPLILSTPLTATTTAATYEVWASHWIHPELVDPEYGLVILASTCDLYSLSQKEEADDAEVEIKSHEEQTVQERHEQRQRCHNKIAFIPRGHLHKPIFELALQAQQAGALAAIIVDPVDGKCAGEKYDQKCLPGASKKHQEGFAMQDLANLWSAVKIPVLLASYDVAQGVKKDIEDMIVEDLRKNSEQSVLAQQASVSDEL